MVDSVYRASAVTSGLRVPDPRVEWQASDRAVTTQEADLSGIYSLDGKLSNWLPAEVNRYKPAAAAPVQELRCGEPSACCGTVGPSSML
jgi:hypothetical protein